MDNDVFGAAQGTVSCESEGANSRVLVESSALLEGRLGEKTFDG